MAKFLTTLEVAQRLGYSPDSVRRFERAGRLRAEKVGDGMRLFLASDVAQFGKTLKKKANQQGGPATDAE